MKWLTMLCGAALFLFSLNASALVVEARGFTMCTQVDSGQCTDGTTYIRPYNGMGTSISDSCDWTGGDCEVWKPKGTTGYTDVKAREG